MKLHTIILAAGKGTRMKSLNNEISKVGYEILGKPLVNYVLDAATSLGNGRNVVIVGFGGNHVIKLVGNQAEIAWQHEQKGSGHAIMQTAPLLAKEEGDTLILSGDVPLLRKTSLEAMIETHIREHNDLTLLTATPDNPFGYGRIVRSQNGEVLKIVEQKDLINDEGLIKEVNAGTYLVNNKKLFEELKNINSNNKSNELYLTDIIALFKNKNYKVGAYILSNVEEMLGTNDRVQLAEAAQILKLRINKAHMLAGVTIEDPNNTYIGPDVKIGPDTIISPGTTILGNSIIGIDNHIGPNTFLSNMIIGDHNSITMSHLVDSQIHNGIKVGPFARIREHADVNDDVRIGNFVELKKSILHKGVKASHLSYLGDAEVGEKTNIGAGTITANYDGVNKSKTTIGKNAFIGSNSTLVAPLKVEEASYVAAGSVINKDVAANSLAIARTRQENKIGYADKIRAKQQKK